MARIKSAPSVRQRDFILWYVISIEERRLNRRSLSIWTRNVV